MHIEPTSRCTLACPACPRTWFSEKFDRAFPKIDLVLDDLVRFLDCESGQTVDHFLLNGNHGDPIYYPNLLDFIDYFRSTKYFKISTNGSFQKPEFWHTLAEKLDSRDTVYFSIDGLEHNNHLYRRNSDWNSIMQGLEIMTKSSVNVVWKTLIFAYNQKELDQIQALAQQYGAKFVSDTTHRFGEASLAPDIKLIDTNRLYETNVETTTLDPQCNKQEYISADGYYWPCCLISTMFTLHKTELWKQRHLWSIKNHNLDQLRSRLQEWQQAIIDKPAQAHIVCKMNCKPGQEFAWAKM